MSLNAMNEVTTHDAEDPDDPGSQESSHTVAVRDVPDDDYVIHPAEGPALVREIVEAAQDADPLTGIVARLWLVDVLAEGGAREGTDTVSYIASKLETSTRTVHKQISRIRSIGIKVLEDHGIQGAA